MRKKRQQPIALRGYKTLLTDSQDIKVQFICETRVQRVLFRLRELVAEANIDVEELSDLQNDIAYISLYIAAETQQMVSDARGRAN